jgi:hypothetical protein
MPAGSISGAVTRLRPTRRILAGVVALAIPLVAATGCDVSPYAMKVNSQVIKQTAVNAELRAWAGNSTYVAAFNSSNSSTGLTVAGDAPGTYSTSWVANILNGMIAGAAVGQHLVATGNLPDQAIIAAARSVSEISQVGWYDFTPQFRDVLVQRLADEATLTPPSVPASTILDVYRHYQSYFFTQICTVQESAATLADAQALVSTGLPSGSPLCYDQVQLEAQPAQFRAAVQDTAVGKVAAPIQTSYGYQVVKVVSRAEQGFTPQVQRVLSTAIISAEGTANTSVQQLLAHTRVQLNPLYGTWKNSQVVPPAAPGATS